MLLDNKLGGFYQFKKQSDNERYYVYRAIGWISLLVYACMGCGIAFMIYHQKKSTVWILVSLFVFEKVINKFYFFKNHPFKKMIDLYFFEIIGYDNSFNKSNASFCYGKELYNSKIIFSVIFSVIFHYAIIGEEQKEVSDLDQHLIPFSIGISTLMFVGNQAFLYSRLYFRSLIYLREGIYLIIQGVFYQFSQVSLLGMILQIGTRWYVLIVGFLFCMLSLSMMIKKQTKFHLGEVFIYLLISQIFGVRLVYEFLYCERNNRAEKILSSVLYSSFINSCWVILFGVTIVFAQSRVINVLDQAVIVSIIGNIAFVIIPSLPTLYLYFKYQIETKLALMIVSIQDLKKLNDNINKYTKRVEILLASAKNSAYLKQLQKVEFDKVLEEIVFPLLQTRILEVEIKLIISTLMGEFDIQIETIYDSNKIAFKSILFEIGSIEYLKKVIYSMSIRNINQLPLVINFNKFSEQTAFEAIQFLSQHSKICQNISADSNVFTSMPHFEQYCQFLSIANLLIISLNKNILPLIPLNPYLITYDLFE